MATRSQKVKLGVFLTAATVLFAGTVIVLTGMGLWQERVTYYIEFRQSVSGLEQGAPVKLRGVLVGTVEAIRVDPDNVEQVEVRIQVDKGTPIKADTKAFINMQGITGLKFIELAQGTADAPKLPAGSEIQAGQSMIEQLTGRATDIGLKIEKLLNNILYMTREQNQKRVDDIVDSTEQTSQNLAQLTSELSQTLQVTRALVSENREGIDELIANANETSKRTNQVLAEVGRLTSTAQGIAQDSKIPQAVAEFRQTNTMVQERLEGLEVGNTMDRVTVALDTLTRLLNNLSQTVNQNQDQLRATLYNFRQAAESFKELARSLRSQPSRLFFDESPEPRDLP
jgi:phospholipid/cholesterol/gamma-HCH transport system substrate-binding protein